MPAGGCPALPELRGNPVRRAPGRGLRSGGGFLADCPPGPGPGRQADGARACAVLAGDVSRAHAGRRARRPGLPGCPGADVDRCPDRRALPPEPGGCRRAGRRAGRDRHVRPARGRRGRVDEAAVRALRVRSRPRHGRWAGVAGGRHRLRGAGRRCGSPIPTLARRRSTASTASLPTGRPGSRTGYGRSAWSAACSTTGPAAPTGDCRRRNGLMAYMTLPWAPVATLINSLPLAGSGPSQRLQNRCSARPGCGIMEAQARAGPGQAGRPLRRLADCKVTCRGIR